jgi:signal transduction histidine kinase
VIKGYVSMLIDGDYDDTDTETRKDAYYAIQQKTAKLVQIINDILYASEFDTGGVKLRKQEYIAIEVDSYIKKIVENHQAAAREKNISLSFEQSNETGLCVRASARYLEVILDNLIDNSLHYTRSGGIITVTARVFPERVRIEVKDNGIGISKQDQKELFQKFKRGANANNVHTDGSGLGLFIVKKMVEAEPGGRVGFESELNKGSTFWVEFERAAEKHKT